jgi:MFS family permease
VVQPFAGRLAQRWSHAIVASSGLALLALGLGVLVVGESVGVVVVVVGSLIASLGAGAANPVLIDASIQFAPPGQSAVSGAVILTIRQLGFALGSALVFAVAGSTTNSPDLTLAFGIAGLIAVVGVVLLQFMRRSANVFRRAELG